MAAPDAPVSPRSRSAASFDRNAGQRALSVAGTARRDDLRLGTLVRAISAEAETVAAALSVWLGQDGAARPAAVARLITEVLRLDSLDVGQDIRDVAKRL